MPSRAGTLMRPEAKCPLRQCCPQVRRKNTQRLPALLTAPIAQEPRHQRRIVQPAPNSRRKPPIGFATRDYRSPWRPSQPRTRGGSRDWPLVLPPAQSRVAIESSRPLELYVARRTDQSVHAESQTLRPGTTDNRQPEEPHHVPPHVRPTTVHKQQR